jgi:hypothetical protein
VRGRPSVFIRAGKLEAALARRSVPRRPHYDFSAFDDQELEDLAVLAEKAEAAGGEPAWTKADLAVLSRLEAQLIGARGATR